MELDELRWKLDRVDAEILKQLERRMELAELAAPPAGLVVTHLLRQAELVASNAEAVRMIEQGAVRIDGQRITSRDLVFSANADLVVQVGKRRFKRVRLLPAG